MEHVMRLLRLALNPFLRMPRLKISIEKLLSFRPWFNAA
jgi:hypothetical protein